MGHRRRRTRGHGVSSDSEESWLDLLRGSRYVCAGAPAIPTLVNDPHEIQPNVMLCAVESALVFIKWVDTVADKLEITVLFSLSLVVVISFVL